MEIPIPTLHLFPILDAKLIALLRSLTPDDWRKTTRAKQWTVKDVATHLLDGNVRTLSISRDKFYGETPENINGYADLVSFLNRLNADWVKATQRLSTTVLIDLLETTGQQYSEHLQQLDPFVPAVFGVDWAGEKESLTWFHVAREYTEKWHHQQQIREAVDRPGIEEPKLYYPVLDTFMMGAPHRYRDVTADNGTCVKVTITGAAGGEWYLVKSPSRWTLTKQQHTAITEVSLHADDAWKLFTKGLSPEEAAARVSIVGEKTLGEPFRTVVAVMA